MTAHDRRPRLLLGLAAVAVAFAAADTYVVVLALPDMMESAGIPIDQLQRGAPIVSGFLLGYVAMLPLIGRIADLRGRVPGAGRPPSCCSPSGSLVTAAAYDLPSLVVGRFLQGVGAGGLVPATLALVADLYPVDRRGVPLGVVSAVQELGSVIGPLYGALILAVSDWRVIFAVNMVVGSSSRRRWCDRWGPARHLTQPGRPGAAPRVGHRRLGRDRLRGRLPGRGRTGRRGARVAGQRRDLGPAVRADVGLGPLGDPARSRRGRGRAAVPRAVLDRAPTHWSTCGAGGRRRRQADLPGALFLAAALGGVILAFATADPRVEVFAPQGWWYLLAAAVATGVFVWHLRTDEAPLVPAGRIASYAGLGVPRRQLLRRRGPGRRADRHPDLRAHHRLPRLPAAGGARPAFASSSRSPSVRSWAAT